MGTGEVNPVYEDAFQLAAKRWSKVIVGDESDIGANVVDDWFGGQFPGQQPYNGAVDDLVIGYDIPDTIDGLGGTLGGSGPVFTRRDRFDRPLSTISGVMFFDGLDLDIMPVGDVKAVILHEMGHVLGLVGTTNERCNLGCSTDNPLQQSQYSCPLATSEYSSIVRRELNLENSGGMGTACGHWEEDNFRTFSSSEVMTGFFEDNLFQPLSSVTVAGLEDIGYTVDYCGSDVWPANEDTIQRFEVYKTSRTMSMDSMMEDIRPLWGLDPSTGEKKDWDELDRTSPLDDNDSSASSSTTPKRFDRKLVIVGVAVFSILFH